MRRGSGMELRRLGAFIISIGRFILRILDVLGFVDVLFYAGDKPYRKYKQDAGYDLLVAETTTIPACRGVDVEVHTTITSRRMWLLLVGRSSTSFKKGLHVGQAVIDCGYSGQLHTWVYNPSDKDVVVLSGERISQIIPFRLQRTFLMRGMFTRKGGRGERGFGSTGGV